jgi:hypothetical protein
MVATLLSVPGRPLMMGLLSIGFHSKHELLPLVSVWIAGCGSAECLTRAAFYINEDGIEEVDNGK